MLLLVGTLVEAIVYFVGVVLARIKLEQFPRSDIIWMEMLA